MEINEKKQYNKPAKNNKQVFYFNDEGKLIVESNKGVWSDGVPYVKMYGNFTCNAKTIGIIINKFKGCPVAVTEIIKRQDYFRMEYPFNGEPVSETTAIVNPTDDDKGLIDEIRNVAEQRDGLIDLKNEYKEANEKFEKAIKKYNNLPWWKRMFKKVDV